MLSILAAAATTITTVLGGIKIGETLKGFQDAKKKRHLGQLLNLVYLRLNECIVTGEQILATLQAVAANEAHLARSTEYLIGYDGIYLHELVSRQREQLLSLGDSIVHLSNIIQSIDASLYLQLRQFMAFKGVGLDWLAVLLERGLIPLDGLRYEDVQTLALKSEFMLPEDADTPAQGRETLPDILKQTNELFMPWYCDVGLIAHRIEERSITIDELVDSKEEDFSKALKAAGLDRLKALLGQNNLWNHLDEAKMGAGKLKDFIETNFSIVDLLLDVGSADLKKASEW